VEDYGVFKSDFRAVFWSESECNVGGFLFVYFYFPGIAPYGYQVELVLKMMTADERIRIRY